MGARARGACVRARALAAGEEDKVEEEEEEEQRWWWKVKKDRDFARARVRVG